MKSLGDYIIVNYHYVHDPAKNKKLGGVFPCLPANFACQVDFLAHQYKLVTIEELVKARKESMSGKFCAITFDDGLRDQYENALRVLVKHRAPATFFVITQTLEGKVPVSHKIHCLRSRFSVTELLERYENFFGEILPRDRFLDQNEHYDDIITSNFKTTVNRLPNDEANDFLVSVFKELGWDEKDIAKELFITQTEIKELKKQGMDIGAHTHNHSPLSRLGEREVGEELLLSCAILGRILGSPARVFSYPHGAYETRHTQILKAAGFEYAVINEKRALELNDHVLRIPRYDVRDLENIMNNTRL